MSLSSSGSPASHRPSRSESAPSVAVSLSSRRPQIVRPRPSNRRRCRGPTSRQTSGCSAGRNRFQVRPRCRCRRRRSPTSQAPSAVGVGAVIVDGASLHRSSSRRRCRRSTSRQIRFASKRSVESPTYRSTPSLSSSVISGVAQAVGPSKSGPSSADVVGAARNSRRRCRGRRRGRSGSRRTERESSGVDRPRRCRRPCLRRHTGPIGIRSPRPSLAGSLSPSRPRSAVPSAQVIAGRHRPCQTQVVGILRVGIRHVSG